MDEPSGPTVVDTTPSAFADNGLAEAIASVLLGGTFLPPTRTRAGTPVRAGSAGTPGGTASPLSFFPSPQDLFFSLTRDAENPAGLQFIPDRVRAGTATGPAGPEELATLFQGGGAGSFSPGGFFPGGPLAGQGLLFGGPDVLDFLRNADLSRLVAPITGGELDTISAIRGATGAASADLSAARSEALRRFSGIDFPFLGLGTTQSFLEGLDPIIQPAIDAATRPLLEGLINQFTQAGQFVQGQGSLPFVRAAQQAVADQAARITPAVFGPALDFAASLTQTQAGREQALGGLIPQLSEAELATFSQRLSAEALPRLIEQAGIDRGVQIFNERLERTLEALRIAMAGVTGQAVAEPGGGGGGGAGSALAAAGGLASSFLSPVPLAPGAQLVSPLLGVKP